MSTYTDTMATGLLTVQRYSFGPQDRVDIHGISYRLKESTIKGHVFVRTGPDGLAENFTHEEVAELIEAGKLIRRPGWYLTESAALRNLNETEFLTSLPIEEQDTVIWREAVCKELMGRDALGALRLSDRKLKEVIDEIYPALLEEETRRQHQSNRCDTRVTVPKKPSPKSVRTWYQLYKDSNMNPLALRDGRHRSGNRAPKIKDDTSQDLVRGFVLRYISSTRPSKRELHDDYKAAAEAENARRAAEGQPPLAIVGLRTFEKQISRLDPFKVCAGREGMQVALRRFAIVQSGLDVTRPMQRIEMDEWKVDLQTLLVDAGVWTTLPPEVRKEVQRNRFWVSVAIDTATRCIAALRFLMEAPSAKTAIATLEMAIFDKSHITRAIGTRTPWLAHGSPEVVVTDSGAGFIARSFLMTVSDLGAKSFRPPAGLPWLRGSIERSFLSARLQLLTRFPGQTFGNVVEKGFYNPELNACLTVKELNEVLIAHVVDIYHNTPHSGLGGETPLNAWKRLSAQWGPLPPPDEETRRHVFGINLRHKITNNGIRAFGLHYQSEDLQRLRATVRQQPVDFRVNRYDLGAVSVRVGAGWMSVPCVFPELAGVSWWDWTAAADDLKRRHADTSALSIDTVREAVARIRDTAEMATARAEIAAPVLTGEVLAKADKDRFRSFSVVYGEAPDDEPGDFLAAGDDSEVDQVLEVPAAAPTATTGPKTTPASCPPVDDADDEFGLLDD